MDGPIGSLSPDQLVASPTTAGSIKYSCLHVQQLLPDLFRLSFSRECDNQEIIHVTLLRRNPSE
jgi:hypothetical protein